MNVCVVRGVLSRDPEVRELRSGGLVVEYDVSVAAHDGRPTETVPVCWFDPADAGMRLAAGEAVVVVGRVRRRFFRGSSGTMSRTELVADKVFGPRQRKAATTAVGALLADADEAFAVGSAA
jgi:single-stranded DNA-binding protein